MEDKKEISELDAVMRLSQILNDSPRLIKLGNREFAIKPLRMGAQWLIAEESCKIAKSDESFTDLVKSFAANIPSVIRCICIAILNDKEKIEGEEYQALYDFIQWETDNKDWMGVLVEILKMLDYNFFYNGCGVIHSFRQTMTRTNQQ